MASLMQELLNALEAEKQIYQELIPISEKKTGILVEGDLQKLQQITDQEQLLIDRVGIIDKKREAVIKDMAVVLGKNPKELDIATLARLMNTQPEEKKKLSEIHDSLRKVMKRLVEVNEKNKNIIENSLEMIEFNMNFIQSTRMSPGNNNYNRNASSVNYGSDVGGGGFDAKQ